MGYKKKCPECQSCLDMIWIMPKRFYRCWLCRDFYNIIDNKLTKLTLEEMGFPQEIIDKVLETLENEKSH